MSSSDELAETEAQLEMIESALLADPGNVELLSLKSDLLTLLTLMKPSGSNSEQQVQISKEISEPHSENQQRLSQELLKLEGVKVRAPLSKTSSELGNAVILAAEEDQTDTKYEEIIVRVVFSHPTSQKLVPCPYYFDGKCNRPSEDCKWSHGELRKLGDLEQYEEVDYRNISVGSQVLSKEKGGVWVRGKVTEIVGDEYLVQLDTGNSEPIVRSVDELCPLEENDNDEDFPVIEESEQVESFIPQEIGSSGIKFGDWENHTKGLGSKLMLKMGWVVGNGLGCRGGGRVEPVTARMYPAGKSLDWCMDMRDKYGDNLGQDVEKIMKKEAKEALKRSKQVADAEKKRDESAKSLFDFINVKLGVGGAKTDSSSKSNNDKVIGEKKKPSIKHESSENLKIKQFKMSESISKLEKEISKLKEGYSRHKLKDPTTANTIKIKLSEKEAELQRLRSASKSITKEEGSRKNKSKLTIF